MLDKIPTQGIFYTTVGYIFSKYVYFHMRFLVEKISALLCFLNVLCVAGPVFSDKKHPTR